MHGTLETGGDIVLLGLVRSFEFSDLSASIS